MSERKEGKMEREREGKLVSIQCMAALVWQMDSSVLRLLYEACFYCILCYIYSQPQSWILFAFDTVLCDGWAYWVSLWWYEFNHYWCSQWIFSIESATKIGFKCFKFAGCFFSSLLRCLPACRHYWSYLNFKVESETTTRPKHDVRCQATKKVAVFTPSKRFCFIDRVQCCTFQGPDNKFIESNYLFVVDGQF